MQSEPLKITYTSEPLIITYTSEPCGEREYCFDITIAGIGKDEMVNFSYADNTGSYSNYSKINQTTLILPRFSIYRDKWSFDQFPQVYASLTIKNAQAYKFSGNIRLDMLNGQVTFSGAYTQDREVLIQSQNIIK